uniref:Uncharacterized protein n=1 Tax=viral metagenome TaxID=1070528 RepID=A0A6M3IDY7_9ZZZZ
MFTIPITVGGSAAISSTSTNTVTYTDPIPLVAKWFDEKFLALKVDIKTYVTAGINTDSGQLQISPMIAEASGGTYVTFIQGNSGTTLVITGGTSATGDMSNGSYYIPLSIVPASGATKLLSTVPYIKFGHRAIAETRPWQAFLCVG